LTEWTKVSIAGEAVKAFDRRNGGSDARTTENH
jgi:hypothetical protein